MKIGDLFDHDFDPNIARAIFKEYGVWPYPFSEVKRDSIEGYFIDWTNNPVDLPIEDINVGDKVADQSLNFTPYWEVSFVDDKRIYLNPVEPNPFLTGVGAGGAALTDMDYEVFSGEAERKIVDNVLAKIDEGLVASYRDISYPLLGSVALRFGPNGTEGGWYNLTDTWSSRGGRQGLTPTEVMVKDAGTIQRLGLPVPPAALDGTMDPHLWGDLVTGNTIFRPRENLEIMFPGENWDDPTAMHSFILNHPLPQVKERNLNMLLDFWNPIPHNRGLSNEEREAWWVGEFANPDLTPLVHKTLADLSQLIPAKQWQEQEFDPYWLVKEKGIETAKNLGWDDILRMYEGSVDATNRRYVSYGYEYLGLDQELLRMASVETSPETMKAILRGLEKQGVEIREVVELDPERYRRLSTIRGDNSAWDYYAGELNDYLRNRLGASNF